MARNTATTVKQYLAALEPDRRAMVEAVRDAINANLEPGFEEGIQYGMIGWYVPHSIYPDGYHCDASQPVPFASVASQKNNISVYLFCMYIDPARVAKFTKEWKATGKRLDMGKSCVRVKKMDGLAIDVIGSAVEGITVDDFLAQYTSQVAGAKKPAKKTAKKKTTKKKTTKKKTTKKKTTKKKTATKRTAKKKTAKKKTAKKKTAKKKTAKKKTAKKKTTKKKTTKKKTTKKKATKKKATKKKTAKKKTAKKKTAKKKTARR